MNGFSVLQNETVINPGHTCRDFDGCLKHDRVFGFHELICGNQLDTSQIRQVTRKMLDQGFPAFHMQVITNQFSIRCVLSIDQTDNIIGLKQSHLTIVKILTSGNFCHPYIPLLLSTSITNPFRVRIRFKHQVNQEWARGG